MSENLSLERLLHGGDPAGDIGRDRLARLEERIVASASRTPQVPFLSGAPSSFRALVLPVWRSSLFAVLLLLLGGLAGEAVFASAGSATLSSPAASASHVTVFAMAAPWQALIEQ